MTTAAIALEPVVLADGEALAALRVEAMRPSLERVGRFDADRARSRLLDTFSPEHTRAIRAGGERAGFLVVKPLEGGLVLEHLYVLPSHQGRGIGSAVLRRVFAEADAQGLDLRVGALRESDANRFYVRHGFVLEREAAYDNYYVRRPALRPDVAGDTLPGSKEP